MKKRCIKQVPLMHFIQIIIKYSSNKKTSGTKALWRTGREINFNAMFLTWTPLKQFYHLYIYVLSHCLMLLRKRLRSLARMEIFAFRILNKFLMQMRLLLVGRNLHESLWSISVMNCLWNVLHFIEPTRATNWVSISSWDKKNKSVHWLLASRKVMWNP